jgi:hypothetical protein
VVNPFRNNVKKNIDILDFLVNCSFESVFSVIQGGSNMTGTNCDLFTHNQSRPCLNHLVLSVTFYLT